MSFGGGSGGGTISSATDVAFSNPATGNFIGYNSGVAKWQNASLTGYAALATGGGQETVSALGNVSGSVSLNLANGNVFSATLTGATTFSFTGAASGKACSIALYLSQDATGSRAVTWPASSTLKWAGGAAPTLTTTASALDILVFETINGGTTWYGSLVGANFS